MSDAFSVRPDNTPTALDLSVDDVFKVDRSPGLYQHYKGNFYRALMTARLSESRDIEVMIYIPLNHHEESPYPRGQPWVRPLEKPLLEGDDCWCDLVDWPDGEKRQRFARVGD